MRALYLTIIFLTSSLVSAATHAAPLAVRVLDKSGDAVPGIVVVAQTDVPQAASDPRAAVMTQSNLQFSPALLVVQTGTSVAFPNNDRVMHHVYSFSDAKTFDIPLYQSQLPAPVTFDNQGIAVVGCNIHDQMMARILVVSTPYFGTTDDNGEVLLNVGEDDVATLIVWHPSWGEFGAHRRPFDGEASVDWVVDQIGARKASGALAWNQDY